MTQHTTTQAALSLQRELAEKLQADLLNGQTIAFMPKMIICMDHGGGNSNVAIHVFSSGNGIQQMKLDTGDRTYLTSALAGTCKDKHWEFEYIGDQAIIEAIAASTAQEPPLHLFRNFKNPEFDSLNVSVRQDSIVCVENGELIQGTIKLILQKLFESNRDNSKFVSLCKHSAAEILYVLPHPSTPEWEKPETLAAYREIFLKAAGIPAEQLILVPEAQSSLAYINQRYTAGHSIEGSVLVIDGGATTIDIICLVPGLGTVCRGAILLGGNDVDVALLQDLLEGISLHMSDLLTPTIALSNVRDAKENKVSFPEYAQHFRISPKNGESIEVELTQQHLDRAFTQKQYDIDISGRPHNASFDVLMGYFLDDAVQKFNAAIASHAEIAEKYPLNRIVVTGGLARVPHVQKMVEKWIAARNPNIVLDVANESWDYEGCVSKGGTLYAKHTVEIAAMMETLPEKMAPAITTARSHFQNGMTGLLTQDILEKTRSTIEENLQEGVSMKQLVRSCTKAIRDMITADYLQEKALSLAGLLEQDPDFADELNHVLHEMLQNIINRESSLKFPEMQFHFPDLCMSQKNIQRIAEAATSAMDGTVSQSPVRLGLELMKCFAANFGIAKIFIRRLRLPDGRLVKRSDYSVEAVANALYTKPMTPKEAERVRNNIDQILNADVENDIREKLSAAFAAYFNKQDFGLIDAMANQIIHYTRQLMYLRNSES